MPVPATKVPRGRSARLVPGLGLPLVVALGCGSHGLEASFAPGWRGDSSETRRREEGQGVLTRLENARPADPVPALVGLTGRGLRGRALPDGAAWHYEGTVDVLPSLSAGVVGFSGDGKVTFLDARTGRLLFSLPAAGRRLEGLSADDKYLLLLLVDADDARRDQVTIVTRRGQIIQSTTALERVGTPLALGGIGLLPWDGRYVSVFDLATGAPLGRLLVEDEIHQVVAIDGAAWVLGTGATRVDAQLLDHLGKNSLQLTLAGLPGDPRWPIDGTEPRLARGSPVAVWAHPEFRRRPGFLKQTFVYAYFDVVMGLEPRTQKVRWTNYFQRSVVGGSSSGHGVNLCLEDGTLHAARYEDGQTEKISSLGVRLKGCVVSPPTRRAKGEARQPVPVQIQRTIRDTSPSMAAAQDFLLADLARRGGSATTRALLAISRDPLSSIAVAQRAADHLAQRREGAAWMIRALEEGAPRAADFDKRQPAAATSTSEESPSRAAHAGDANPAGSADPEEDAARLDFDLPEAGLRPPPVVALAQALTAMQERSAAPVLALYLQTPSITGAPTRAILEALQQLGGAAQVPALETYFFRFKNAGGDADSIHALVLAADFLLHHADIPGRARVLGTIDDVLTHPKVRQALIEHFTKQDFKVTSSDSPPPGE